MKRRILTAKILAEFKEHLILEERSAATVEKYIRDVKIFAIFADGNEITKETVIEYKKHLQECYAVRSVNPMLASLNSLFVFLDWHELKVKSIKLQQQIYCPEEKELTKAEYTRLCRAAERKHNERLNLILQTICGTGIRVSELQYITVEAVKCGEATVSSKAKTRSVFIVKELQKNCSATYEEHLEIVRDCLENDKTYGAMALKYDCSYQQVCNWVQRYEKMGLAGLEDRRGRRAGTQPSRTPEELRDKIAVLERKNRDLKMENDLLKKVRELEMKDRYL